jgi:PEGA domain
MRMLRKFCCVWVLLVFVGAAFAENKVLGEVELQGASKVERDSGVWIDGQYLGYLKELKGDKKILLLPGEHEIVVRQDGYQDFDTHLTLQPAEKQVLVVTMAKDSRFKMPAVFSEVKLAVNPNRAAVFVDDLFVGHASEFDGVAHSLLVAPGHRKITISLPGYETFQTEVNLAPKQKFKLRTDLLKEPASVATSASN